MSQTYWKANKAVSTKIAALVADQEAALKSARAMAKELGAKSFYRVESGYGGTSIVGFQFDQEPDKKLWCRLKNTDDGWRPRHSKANAELHERMNSLKRNPRDDAADIIGMKTFGSFEGGLSWRVPGIWMVNGVAYLSVPDDVKPKGCVRVSDLQFERATAKRKTAKAK